MMMITWSRSWSHSGCDTLPRPRWCCCKPEHWWIGDVGHFHYDKVMSGDFGVDDNNKQNQYNFILSVVEITFSSPSLQISTVSVNLWWIKEYKSSLVLTWRITEHISFSCMYRWFVSDVTVLLEASLTILLLSWDIVGNVCVVTLLREPEMTMITVMVTPVIMKWRWSCEPVLTSHSVFPNRLFNLIKEFDDNWDFYELRDPTCITFLMHRTSSSPSPSMLLVTDSSSLTLISGPST